jgi:hypothetical protein
MVECGFPARAGVALVRQGRWLNLPTSVVITGCNSLPVLPANSPFLPAASGGHIRKHQISHYFDGSSSHPEWLGEVA